ncbi:MAG: hypothetical protein COB13_000745 [OCS116 cluster bacterium]|nr:hypothetical protein [OCS116 cluster bacterium]
MDVSNFLNPKMYKKIELLPPEALKYLLKQVESMPDSHPEKQKMLRIADIATKTLIKQGELEEAEKRKYNLKRYFYLPFSRILFDGEMDQRQIGRISRHSMEKIWSYLETQLMTTEVDELEQSFNAAVRQKEMKKARIIVNEFNRLAGQRLEEIIEKCKDNEKEWTRFSGAIGSKLVAREAEELSYYLQNIDEVEKALKFFAGEIPDLAGNVLSKITNEMIRIKEAQPKIFPLYITLLIDSLKRPSHVLRVIQKYYRIDDASSAAKCDLSILGDILLFNAKVNLHNFISSENSQENHEQHLQYYVNYASIILGIEREFDVSPISSWGKEIIGLKTRAADALEEDILTCPRLLTSVLGRYQKIADGKPATEPDQFDIDELNASVYLLHGIKLYIEAASCHAMFTESYRKCVQFIDIFSVAIVEQMRRVSNENKKALLVYLDISTGLIKIIKDPEQADVYHKGGLLAVRDVEYK